MRRGNKGDRQDRWPADADDVVDRVVVLGRERGVDFVFVVDLVVSVQEGIGMHQLVCSVESKFVDQSQREDVPDVLARGRPVVVVGAKEKGCVLLE